MKSGKRRAGGRRRRRSAAKRVPRDMSSAISPPELFANSRQPLHRGKKLVRKKKKEKRKKKKERELSKRGELERFAKKGREGEGERK